MRDIVLPEELCFRIMEQTDENFIYSAFVKSLNKNCMLLDHKISVTQSYECLRMILQNLLRKATCLILCDKSYLNAIVGFVIFEREQRRTCVHYVYTKEGFRGLGYSTLLWSFATRNLDKDDAVWISNMSTRARNILDQHKVAWTFKPAMLFSTKTFQQYSHQDNTKYANEEKARNSKPSAI